METKTKYIKFEQDAVIILDDIDSRSIPVKGLKFCGFCTLPDKRSLYHYSPSAPAKPLHSLSEGETSSDRISDGLKSGISPVSPSKETGGRLNSEAKL